MYVNTDNGLTNTDWLTNDRPDLSSEKEPHMDIQKEISGHEPQLRLDTKTDWLTDRQLQHNFDFDFDVTRVCNQ
jgi:hypothetical protein